MVRSGSGSQFDGGDSQGPDVCLEVVTRDLQTLVVRQERMEVIVSTLLTCSMTSGAIQHGVPTNVWRDFCRLKSPPVASQDETPKSAICTVPSSPRRMFPALMSLIDQSEA